MEQLERLKRQNQYMRLMHKTNLDSTVSMVRERNHSDYTRIRNERIDGEYRKKSNKEEDLREKKVIILVMQDHWISMNISRQRGKIRVDEFYRKKNKDHVKEYQSRINVEDKKMNDQIHTIKTLEAREQKLRNKLEQTSMKNSRMEELIKGVSRAHSPLDTSSIQAELYGTTNKSRTKLKLKDSYNTISFVDRQSTTVDRSGSIGKKEGNDEVEENIEVEEHQGEKSGFKIIHKRRKNKHVNRYK